MSILKVQLDQIPAEVRQALLDAATFCIENPQKGYNSYALAYLDAIPMSMESAKQFGKTPAEALQVQLLYVLNNLSSWRGQRAREAKQTLERFAKRGK